jgi:phosphopantetheinyl transferase
MPLFFKENIDRGTLALWQLKESVEELLNLIDLTQIEKEKYKKFTNDRRKKEWLATRVLLKEVVSKESTISYNKHGKPFLKDSDYNIGISHSSDFAALITCREKIPGIDIENINRIIEKIAPKFMSETELQACLNDNNKYSKKKLFIHWSAKEAVFKMIPHHGIEFSTQINIQPFNLDISGGGINTVYKHEGNEQIIPLSYRFIENNLLVWGLY